jgi:phosphoserine phosphatase RsbU/P
MRILIAEDDPTSQIVLRTVLTRAGHDILAVNDGAEALAVLSQPDAPRLAVLDWMMPEVDGVEVCRRLRAADDEPRYLILLTALGRQEDIVAGLDAGADDYVTKPFHKKELLARVTVGERMLTLQRALAQRVQELEAALAQIRTLQGMLPICATCKKIRDDEGYWHQVESYVSAHSGAVFTHGICPDCLAQMNAELCGKD